VPMFADCELGAEGTEGCRAFSKRETIIRGDQFAKNGLPKKFLETER